MKQCHCVTVIQGVPVYCPHDCAPDGSFSIGRVYSSPVEFELAIPFQGVAIDGTTVVVKGVESQRKGWICPKCDAVVSPDEKTCPYCKPKPKKESDGNQPTHISE